MNETVLCAHCAADVPAGSWRCAECGKDPRLGGRYTLLDRLGQGAVGTTYRARRDSDGAVVCVKELLIRRLDGFKTQDLFEREARTLRELSHPGVLRYLDAFTAGDRKTLGVYLVTELVDGETLAAEAARHRYSEEEVLELLVELLGILVYLHGLEPPLIHRDLKPTNIMRRRDGDLVLIDFGAVKDAATDADLGGSTIAGTFGYMPPEQLAGRATPASDLYAVGAIAVELLSRRSPQDLLDDRNELRWREAVDVQPAFAALLGRLLAPDPARRASDAEAVRGEVRAILEGRAPAPAPEAPRFSLPPALEQLLGGPLVIPGRRDSPADPGPPPAPAPRELPPRFIRSVSPTSLPFILFGALFGGIGLYVGLSIYASMPVTGFVTLPIALVFGTIGGGTVLLSILRVMKLRATYRDGDATLGVVSDVRLDTSLRVNGASPYAIHYTFAAPDGERAGRTRTWSVPRDMFPGRPVHVIYDRRKPRRNVLYPVPGRR